MNCRNGFRVWCSRLSNNKAVSVYLLFHMATSDKHYMQKHNLKIAIIHLFLKNFAHRDSPIVAKHNVGSTFKIV